MLNLSELAFKVNTDELVTAANKVAELGKSIEGLSGSFDKLEKSGQKVSKVQKSTSDAIEKSNDAVTSSAKNTSAAMDSATRMVEKQALAMKVFRGETIQVSDEVLSLGSSFTKGQSSQLASLKLLGATTEQMKVMANEFNNFNRITSANTFDNSTAGIARLNKEIAEMQRVNEFTSRGIALTRDEIVNLVRDSERLTQQFKSEKLTADQLNQAMFGLEEETVRLAKVKNDLNARTAESERLAKLEAATTIKARNDAAKATSFLERELARTDNVLEGFNNSLNVTSSNRLMKFREQLKLSGVDSVTAAKMLKTYEDRLKAISEVNTSKQAKNRKDELDYLARATSVQIGDIGVSLAGGQNPLTVLIQQGDQLRGVLNQVGGDAKEMQMAMSKAFSQIVVGSVDVVKALGTFVAGAFMDSGKAVVGFISRVSMMDAVMEKAKKHYASLGEEGFKYIGVLNKLGVIASGFFAGAIAASTATVIALGIAFTQTLTAQDNLARSLVSSGASIGATSDELMKLAANAKNTGSTFVEVLNVFGKLSEVGGISKDALLGIAEAALTLESTGGRAAEKTVEMFGKLGEKPLETLSDYAVKTGLVTQAEMLRIDTLVKLGKETSATEEATRILSAAVTKEAEVMDASLSSISRLWIDIKRGTNEAWGAVQEFASSDAIITPLKLVLQTVATMAVEVWYGIKGIGESLGGLGAIAAAVMTDIKNLDTNFTSSKQMLGVISEQDKAREASYKDAIARIFQEGKYSREEYQKTALAAAQTRKVQSDAEKSRLAYEKAMEPYRKKDLELDAKKVTQTEFIDAAVKQVNKGLAEGAKLNAVDLELVKKIAAEKWKDAQKKTRGTSQETKDAERRIDLLNKEVGLTASYNNDLAALQRQRAAGKITEDEYIANVETLIKLQPFYLAQLKEERKIVDVLMQDYIKVQEARDKSISDYINKLNESQYALLDEEQSLKLQAELIGKTDTERKKAIATRKAEIVLEKELRRISELSKYGLTPSQQKELEEARIKAYDNFALATKNINTEIANDLNDQINKALSTGLADALSTALFEGGKAGAKKLRDVLVSELKRQITLNIQAQVSANMQGGVSGMQSIIGSVAKAGGSFSTGNYAAGIGGLASDFSGWAYDQGFEGLGDAAFELFDLADSFGSVIDSSIGYLGALNSALDGDYGAAIGSAIGTYFGGPIGGMIGNALGSMLGLVDTSGTYHTGGTGAYSAAQGGIYGGAGLAGQLDFDLGSYVTKTATETAVGISTSIVKMLDSTAAAFGQQAGYYAATAFADDTSEDGAWGALMLKLGDSIVVDWKRGTDKWPGREFANGEEGVKEYAAALAVDIRTALDAMDLPEWASKLLGNLGNSPTLENLSGAVTTINQIQAAVKYFSDTLGYTVTDLTGFINATGDVGAAMQSMSTYYENFYSQEERTATLTRQMTAEFTKLGKELPTSKAAFRAMVDAAVAAGDTTLVANLLALQNGVISLIPAMEEASGVVNRTAKEIAESIAELQNTLSGTEYDLAIARSQDMRSSALQREAALIEANTIKQNLAESARAKAIFGLTSEEVALYDTNIQRQKELDLLQAQNKAFEEGVQSFNNYYSLFATEEQKRADAIYRIQAAIGSEIDTTDEYISYVNALITAYGVGSAEVKKATDIASDFNSVFNQVAAVIETTTLTLSQAIAGLRTTNATRTVEQVAGNFLNLENELFNLQNEGNTSVLRSRILSGLSDVKDSLTGLSEVDLQNAIWAFQDGKVEMQKLADDAKAAQDKAIKDAETIANAQKQITDERLSLERQLLELQGNTTEIRRRELEAINPSNQALQEQIWLLQDQAEALQKANAIADERKGLEMQLLELQGNTAEIRRRELEALDPANRALQEQIWAMEDTKKAADELVSAWQNVTDSIFEEVARIRGLFGTGSTATLGSARTEFDLATMLARAGDQASAERLPELSRALLEIAGSQAASLTDLRRIQAATANSLGQTGNILTYGAGLTPSYSGTILSTTGNLGSASTTAILPSSASSSLTSSFSNDAVVAAVNNLNANIDLLRSEVRSDVTHNAKTARLLDRVIPDGQSVQVVIAV